MHGEHVSDVISSTEVAGGKWWLVGWNGNVPQHGRNPQDEKDLHTTESVLGLLGPKGDLWGGMERTPKVGEIPKMGKDLHPMESELGLSLANRVHRIHREHVVDVISSTGVAGCKEWSMGC